jgi:hypothetical protein
LIANFINNKDLPLEYFYLCHINYIPVDGGRLAYTADHKNIIVHREVPADYPTETAKSMDMKDTWQVEKVLNII